MKVTFSPTSTVNAPSSKPPVGSLPAFDFAPLNRVVFGPGCLARIGELVRELGGRRVLMVTDPGLEQAGHPQRANGYLVSAGLEVFPFDAVRENPTNREVEAGAEFARNNQIDFILAIGGGSAMDCAKGVNFLLSNGGKISDYMGFNKASKPMLPSIGVPTTTGTGSEAQSYAIITDEASHMKMACGDKKAAFRVAVLDPEVTLSQPRTVTAITGIDALAHALESYVCTRRNPISQLFALSAWRHLEANIETVLAEPTNLDARSAMQLGAHFAGIAIEHSMLGAAHACANPLTAHYGITHGVAVGLMMPHVIRFNAMAVESLYSEMTAANAMGNGEPASEILARRMTGLLTLAGYPIRLRDHQVSEGILHLLAEEASQQWTARFNPHAVTEDDLHRLYQAAW